MAASAARDSRKLLRLWGCRRAWISCSCRAACAPAWRGTSRTSCSALSGAVWAFLLAERFDGIGPWSRSADRVPARARAARARRRRLGLQHERLVPEPAHRPRPARPHAADAAAALADDRERRLHAVLGLGSGLRGRRGARLRDSRARAADRRRPGSRSRCSTSPRAPRSCSRSPTSGGASPSSRRAAPRRSTPTPCACSSS